MPDDGEPREADDGQEKLPAGPADEPQDADSNTGPEDALDVDDGDEPGERSAAESDPSVDDVAATAEDDTNEEGVSDDEDGSIADTSDDEDESADEDGDGADEAAADDDAEDDVEAGEDETAADDDVDDDTEVAEDEPAEDDADDEDVADADGEAVDDADGEDADDAEEDAMDDDADDVAADDEDVADEAVDDAEEDAMDDDVDDVAADDEDVADEAVDDADGEDADDAEEDEMDADVDDEAPDGEDVDDADDEAPDDEAVEGDDANEELSADADADGDDPSATAVGNGGVESDGFGGISTPPDDEEMPLADHIEEMISRLAIVLLIGAAGTALGILWAADAIDIIWSDAIPEADEWPPHLYHPLELWLTRIKVAGLLGIMVALPMFVYQCYRFMRPGLYPHERKYYLAAVPTSVVLAGVGMLFSYLVVLPILFEYFTFYSEGSAEIHYALGETFNLVITLTAFLAIVFQIPLLIMMAVMMGVVTRRWLADKRLYFWAAFFGLAFMFTIDPTAMAAIMVAIVMIVLFEGTLLILKWVGVD